MEKKISFEATIHNVNFHNSKTSDDSWADLSLRALGDANILAASVLPRAKNKIATITFTVEIDE